MTTIANLVVATELDPQGIQRGLDRALGNMRRFGVEAGNIRLDKLVSEATRVASDLERQFELSLTNIRERMAGGFLDVRSAERQAVAAGEAMNRGLMSALMEMRALDVAPPEVEQAIVSRMRAIGKTSGAALLAEIESASRRAATLASAAPPMPPDRPPDDDARRRVREANRGARMLERLVIETSLDNNGLRQGLDQALGYTRRFARVAKEEFRQLGSEQDGVAAAQRIGNGLDREFEAISLRLKEQLFRGAIDPARAATEATRLAQAYNNALLGTLESFRAGAAMDKRLASELPAIEKLIVTRLSDAGLRGGEALTRAMGESVRRGLGTTMVSSLDRIGVATDAATGGLSRFQNQAARTGISVAFAMESFASGTEQGVNTALRSLATFGLAFGGPQGIILASVATAAAGIYQFFEQTRKQIEEFRKDLAQMANEGQGDQLKEQARRLYFGTPYSEEGKLRAPSDRVKGAFSGSIADLRAQEAELIALIRSAPSLLASAADRERLKQLRAMLGPMEDKLREIQAAAINVASQPADIGNLPIVTTARAPGAKDAKPYADLAKQVDVLTDAYRGMTAQGVAPSVAMQLRLQEILRQTRLELFNIRDAATPAGNALRDIQAKILATGVDESMFKLPELKLDTRSAEERVGALTDRLELLRAAYGNFDVNTLVAFGDVAAEVDRLTRSIDEQGGPLRAAQGDVRALAAALRSLKSATDIEWTPAMAADLRTSIEQGLAAINGRGRETSEIFDSMRDGLQGVLDVAGALGTVGDDLRDIGGSALNLVGALKQVSDVRRERAAAAAREAKTPGTGGAMAGFGGLLSSIGSFVGVIGAGMSLISGVMGLFSRNNVVLEENNRRLQDLREQMAETEGLQTNLDILGVIRSLDYSTNAEFERAVRKDTARAHAIFEEAVREAGLTMEQFNKIMDEFGIVPEKSFTWLFQFGEALEMATQRATRFGNSLDDQRELRNLRSQVFGTTGPEDSLKSAIALLDQFAPALGSALTGIDTSTAEGQAAVREQLKRWVEMIEAGAITTEQLGTLTGVKDFASIILDLTGSLDQLKKSTDEVTRAQSVNIPSWYKVGALRLMAADPMAPPSTSTGRSPLNIAPSDVRPSTPTSTPQMAVGAAFYGDVLIDARQLSAAELFETVMREGQRRASARYRDSTRWADVQN